MTSIAPALCVPEDVPERVLTPEEISKLTLRLAKGKTSLVLEHPFIGTIAMNMPFELDFWLPTAGTDGTKVYFNPDFIDTLTDEELKFLIAHECMHPMLEHNYRRFERQHKKWNHAADYVINKLLVDDKIGKMPDVGLYDEQIYADGGGTSDGIYKILPDMPDEDGGSGPGNGSGMDVCLDAEGTPAEKAQEAAIWKVKVAQAAQAARMCGKMSANMETLVEEILNPKVDWREVLQRFVVKLKADDRTWARPNRRFIQQGMYLPSRDGEAMGPLVFAVDCSGSCWGDIPQFANEVRIVHQDHKPLTLHVIYFDTSVSHMDTFSRDDEFHMEGHGGGGTAFSPIFKEIAELDEEPVACIVLTDLCCDDFGPEPDYPVLWVSNHSDEAPWGQVVKM